MRTRSSLLRSFSLLAAATATAASFGCDAPTPEPTGADVTLAFEARVGDAPFACTSSYDGVGTSGTNLAPQDLRLYVHDVRLVTDGGEEVPLTMEEDGKFQRDGVALLDFEDRSGTCANGTPGTHTAITGTAPEGTYAGVRFTLGVPFELNHQNPATAAPPLDDTTMFWNWQGGYKFLRLDQATTGLGTGFFVHLGSTGCDGDPVTGGVTTCANENRPTVSLDGFDPTSGAVIIDVASLLADNDLDADQGGAPGCMSGPTDPECGPIFSRLGLPFGPAPAGAQSLFRAP